MCLGRLCDSISFSNGTHFHFILSLFPVSGVNLEYFNANLANQTFLTVIVSTHSKAVIGF